LDAGSDWVVRFHRGRDAGDVAAHAWRAGQLDLGIGDRIVFAIGVLARTIGRGVGVRSWEVIPLCGRP
jgi:hypothetical protein